MKTLSLHIQNQIAEVTFLRTNVKNAFDALMIEELIQTWDLISSDPTIKALMLMGSGGFFSSGADLNWMLECSDYSEEKNLKDAQKLDQMLISLQALQVPKFAFVEGGAFGGALGILACCDGVLAESKSQFSFSEIHLGLAPAVIAPYVVKAIGERRARYCFLTGVKFGVVQAYEWGLVHRELCDSDGLLQAKESLQRHFENSSHEALKACYEVPTYSHEQTTACIARLRTLPHAQEKMKQFLGARSR